MKKYLEEDIRENVHEEINKDKDPDDKKGTK